MMRWPWAVVVVGLAGGACRAGAPGAVPMEPPPPQIEPAVGLGSGLVDPRAITLLRAMSDRLTAATSLAFEAEETYDEVPEHSPRRQVSNVRHVAMRRPDRLVGDASGDALNRSYFYDGRAFSVYDREQNVWASGTVPPTIDAALDWMFEKTNTVVPMADLFYTDVYTRLTEAIQRGSYLGIHDAAGVPCHHLAFEQGTIDWQIWIDAGRDPVPRKLVIAYKTEDEVPQYSVTIRKWNLRARLPEALFAFEPPPGSTRVDISPAWAANTPAGAGAPAGADAAKPQEPRP